MALDKIYNIELEVFGALYIAFTLIGTVNLFP